ncbi:MAG: leucine-rich repeat domain-containing protein [Paramuribaculum sp.]|nr:leucine-rich repeat domain-containing protein [Paramuribaculum sp.]
MELTALVSKAQTVTVDEIRYQLNGEDATAFVSGYTDGITKADIKSSVEYDGKDYTVTSIGLRAFQYCRTLTDVTIPNSITYIGSSAFNRCENLSEVTIPNSVTVIGSGAFSSCYLLKTITVDKSNESYMDIDGVLYNKDVTALIQCPCAISSTSITIPESVTEIGSSAFADCKSLTEVVIPNSVTYIGSSAFFNCQSLKEITIPNSISTLTDGIFSNCSSLTSITIPTSVSRIFDSAFAYCTSLKEITIPKSVFSIGTMAIGFCSSLQSINVEENNPNYADIDGVLYNKDITTLIQCPGAKNSITIPNSVITLGNWSFADCDALTEVTIPTSVNILGDAVFQYCDGLTSMTLPPSIKSIGGMAFYWCTNLKSVTIPSTVTSIGSSVFAVCDNLKEVYYAAKNPIEGSSLIFSNSAYSNATLFVPETAIAKCKEIDPWKNFNSIVAHEFPEDIVLIEDVNYLLNEDSETATITGYDENITKADIPATVVVNGKEYTVTEIGTQAFYNCSNLTEVSIPSTITKIGTQAFYNCSNLTSVNIPASVMMIGDWAFGQCLRLKELIIGNSETPVNERATALSAYPASVTATNSGTIIGISAFNGCSALTDLTIGNSVISIGHSAFFSCAELTAVTIPNSVTFIGNMAFAYCSLTSVTIPASVTSIGDAAFLSCSKLTSVTLPASVTSIGMTVFAYCNDLKEVYYAAETPIEGDNNIFSASAYENATLFVPEAAIAKCKEIAPWKNFGNIAAHKFSGIDVAEANEPVITLTPMTINVAGVADDCEVSVYTLAGQMIASERGNCSVAVANRGVYIVKVGSKTVKVSVTR